MSVQIKERYNADKEYFTSPAKITATQKEVHLAAIKKNNMKNKNLDLDRYYSKLRSPFERVFSQQRRRTRYIGIAKNQFAEFMNGYLLQSKKINGYCLNTVKSCGYLQYGEFAFNCKKIYIK